MSVDCPNVQCEAILFLRFWVSESADLPSSCFNIYLSMIYRYAPFLLHFPFKCFTEMFYICLVMLAEYWRSSHKIYKWMFLLLGVSHLAECANSDEELFKRFPLTLIWTESKVYRSILYIRSSVPSNIFWLRLCKKKRTKSKHSNDRNNACSSRECSLSWWFLLVQIDNCHSSMVLSRYDTVSR